MIPVMRSRYASCSPSVFSTSTKNKTLSFENWMMFFSFRHYSSLSLSSLTSSIHATQYSQ